MRTPVCAQGGDLERGSGDMTSGQHSPQDPFPREDHLNGFTLVWLLASFPGIALSLQCPSSGRPLKDLCLTLPSLAMAQCPNWLLPGRVSGPFSGIGFYESPCIPTCKCIHVPTHWPTQSPHPFPFLALDSSLSVFLWSLNLWTHGLHQVHLQTSGWSTEYRNCPE